MNIYKNEKLLITIAMKSYQQSKVSSCLEKVFNIHEASWNNESLEGQNSIIKYEAIVSPKTFENQIDAVSYVYQMTRQSYYFWTPNKLKSTNETYELFYTKQDCIDYINNLNDNGWNYEFKHKNWGYLDDYYYVYEDKEHMQWIHFERIKINGNEKK